jgi:hypothetical protein
MSVSAWLQFIFIPGHAIDPFDRARCALQAGEQATQAAADAANAAADAVDAAADAAAGAAQ